MLDILRYSFFQYALIGGILLACIASILGVFIVMRQEANTAHSISNFLFLGIAISLVASTNSAIVSFFSSITGNTSETAQYMYYFFAFVFALLASVAIFFIEKSAIITKESTKEIISQGGMAGAIFTLGFLGNLSIDINSYLFGSILLVNTTDIVLIGILLVVILLFLKLFGKQFLATIINEDIAKSSGLPVEKYHFGFLVVMSIFITLAIKIFGILLIGAFLVIPANTAKILGKNIKQVFLYTISISVLAVITGLFSAHFLDTSAGATIVLVLLTVFILSLIFRKK